LCVATDPWQRNTLVCGHPDLQYQDRRPRQETAHGVRDWPLA
jgi:hypothetical protein